MFKIIKKGLCCVLCLLVLAGCRMPRTQSKESDGKVKIVATIFPLYDFVRAVGGDEVDLTLLIDPGMEIHAFDPSPSNLRNIQSAQRFFCIGGESDEWVETLTGDFHVKTKRLMDCVPLLNEEGEEEADEHIWTSPANAKLMVAAICDELCDADSENAPMFRQNAQNYIEKITQVQKEIADILSAVENPFLLVADRFALRYFTAEYDLPHEAAFGGCAVSTDISVKTMIRLVGTVKEKQIPSVFTTEMSSREIALALQEETGVKLFELHSAHTVTRDDFKNGVTYVDIMKRNAATLKEAFGG